MLLLPLTVEYDSIYTHTHTHTHTHSDTSYERAWTQLVFVLSENSIFTLKHHPSCFQIKWAFQLFNL